MKKWLIFSAIFLIFIASFAYLQLHSGVFYSKLQDKSKLKLIELDRYNKRDDSVKPDHESEFYRDYVINPNDKYDYKYGSPVYISPELPGGVYAPASSIVLVTVINILILGGIFIFVVFAFMKLYKYWKK